MDNETNKWITDTTEDMYDIINDKFLYRNSIINNFITNESIYFIIAGKGIGKSLLLICKRKHLERKYGNTVLILPQDKPYIGFMSDMRDNMGSGIIEYLKDWERCKKIWTLSIQISALTQAGFKKREFESWRSIPSIKADKQMMAYLFDDAQTIDFVFNSLLMCSVNEIQNIINAYGPLIDKKFREINQSIIYFFDRIDQAINNSISAIWIPVQVGLMEAVWSTTKANPHIKIYMSIRQEAYAKYRSKNKNAMLSSITLIKYTNDELKDLIDNLVVFYEKKKCLSDFLGKKNVKNTTTGNPETVFSFMNRYSLGRPRDFVEFCHGFSKLMLQSEAVDATSIKESIIDTASRYIVSSVHEEVRPLLNCLKDVEYFDNLLKMIKHNILTYEELQEICSLYNNKSCNKDCALCERNEHPFCDLYNMGLLGMIVKSEGKVYQKFKSPYEEMQFGLRNDTPFFLIHPALRGYIDRLHHDTLRNQGYVLLPNILVGNGVKWKPFYSKLVYIDKLILDIKAEKFDELQKIVTLFRSEKKKFSVDLETIKQLCEKAKEIYDMESLSKIMNILVLMGIKEEDIYASLKIQFVKMPIPLGINYQYVNCEIPESYVTNDSPQSSIDNFRKSVICIYYEDTFLGSGFIGVYNKKYYIITCMHNFDNHSDYFNSNKDVTIMISDKRVKSIKAELLNYEVENINSRGSLQDIAILKCDNEVLSECSCTYLEENIVVNQESSLEAYGYNNDAFLSGNIISFNVDLLATEVAKGYHLIGINKTSIIDNGNSGSPIIDKSNNKLVGMVEGATKGNLAIYISVNDIITAIKLFEEETGL